MKNTEAIKLEKLLIKLHAANIEGNNDGSFQLGGYIISPIRWGEDGEDIELHTEEMIDEFHEILQFVDTNFVESD
jgi:hypothetical protein